MPGTLQSYLKFAYGSFLKPHTGDGSGNQQDALESFYEYQADAYDTTRTALLRGRDDMIRLVAAQLKYKQFDRKPVWVDIGGGTGWNIEQMGKHLDVANFFSAVYLVDLTPSLLKVAQARFEKLGWSNIKVVCMDCRYFRLDDHHSLESKESAKADLVTMSYSLTMIPDFFPVIDMTTTLLADTGIFGMVDFYAQTEVEFMRRDYIGGFLDRHCTWLNRTFWRTWFEQDRVMFDGGRRDYLEYRFGTRLSINKRNAMLPGLRIPFYIWIGCSRHHPLAQLDVSAIKTSFSLAPEGMIRPDMPLPSVFYQNNQRRTYYQDDLHPAKPQQRALSDFNTEELADAMQGVSIKHDDVVLVPSDSSDLIQALLLQSSGTVHTFDPSATRNHLLELKVAAYQSLQPNELRKLYEEQDSSDFRNLLMDNLSPYMSSQAIQHWLNYGFKGWLSSNKPNPKLAPPPATEPQDLAILSSPRIYEGLRIHTSTLSDLLTRTSPNTLTLVFLPDVLDTRDPTPLQNLDKALATQGRVILKSSDAKPWQTGILENMGFKTERVGSSIWVCSKM